MKKKTIILVCLMFVLTACSSKKEDSSLKEITLVLDWTPNTNHTGIYVADSLGYFEEAGFRVTIIQPPENGATELVASGGAQYGIDFQEYLAAAFGAEHPLPVTAVAAILQHNTSGLVSLKDTGIDSPEKLEGKKYATWEIPIEQEILADVVSKAGGDFEKVNLIPAYVDDIVAGLSSGLDCIWIYYAWEGIKLETEDIDTNFIAFKDVNPVFDFYSPVIIVNNDYMEENSEDVRAFMQAVKKGYEYAAEHPEDAAEILLEAVPELDETLVTESQRYISGQYISDADTWGIIDENRWDGFYQWVNEKGLVEKPMEPGQGFTNKYIE